MAAGTIFSGTFNPNDYDYIDVIHKGNSPTSKALIIQRVYPALGLTNVGLMVGASVASNGDIASFDRIINFNTNEISTSDCYKRLKPNSGSPSTTPDTNACVPYQIIGYN